MMVLLKAIILVRLRPRFQALTPFSTRCLLSVLLPISTIHYHLALVALALAFVALVVVALALALVALAFVALVVVALALVIQGR